MNLSLDVVARGMANLGLRLLVTKTKAIILITVFFLENYGFHLKEHHKITRNRTEKKLGFGKHLECTAAKVMKTTSCWQD